MILKLNSGISSLSLEPYMKYVSVGHHEFFSLPEGRDHYKLLSYLSSQLPPKSKVGDLGTLLGSSAIALATNPEVNVYSCDVADCVPENSGYKLLPNISFSQTNAKEFLKSLIDSNMILIDVSPHDGIQETSMMSYLENNGYRGIVILDDIDMNPEMRKFWSDITLKKIDATLYGHWSGTGIVIFDEDTIDVVME